jgi:hypothetical protein
MIEAALEYWKRGWHPIAVEPASPGNRESGKRPIRKWRNQQWNISSLQQSFRRSVNIGLDCGKSGIVIVDCDSKEARLHARKTCKSTGYVVETGGNGLHLYYTSPPGQIIRNRQRIAGLALDLRGEGGYVVAPPSRHYTGGTYRVVENGELEVFDPNWLPQKEYVPVALTDGTVELDRLRFRAKRFGLTKTAAEGNRDNTAFVVACFFVQALCLPPEIALEELKAWNMYMVKPPLPEKRLEYKVKEALRLKHRSHR